MLILLLIILIILGILGTILGDDMAEYWTYLILITLAISVILLILYPFKISEKLKMYEEENIKIEEKVKSTVQAYMNYEGDTYKNLIEDANLETLLIKYPELNSNELVKSEIELYKENSNKIKDLKEKEITKSIWDWWIRFNIGG